MKKILSAALFALITFTSVTASAQRFDVKAFDKDVAVRKRVLHLPKRFEIAPQIGLTFLQDFKHTLLMGARFEYHILDWLSVGAFVYGGVFSWDSELTNAIEKTLPNTMNPNTDVDPSPSKKLMKDALDTLLMKAGVFLAYTPWQGKLSLFGKVFGKFDMSLYAGLGMVLLKAGSLPIKPTGCPSPGTNDTDRYVDPTGTCSYALHLDPGGPGETYSNGGFKLGPMFGFGLRFWVLKWLAVNFNFQSIFIKRNPAGFDSGGDISPDASNVVIVDKKDESWNNLMSFTLGVSFFFPMKAPRSK